MTVRQLPSLVFPFHDPNNIELKFLKQAFGEMKANFKTAFVSITPKTVDANPEAVEFLNKESFFVTNLNPPDSFAGDHFVNAFKNALEHSKPEEILHLCTSDRLAFALLTSYKQSFLEEISKLDFRDAPRLYARSAQAWASHPRNYQAAEAMVTKVGEILFNVTLDFTWCHLALTAEKLANVLVKLNAHDFVVFAQLVFNVKDELQMKEVDWLAWEDPYIFEKSAEALKTERENDPKEIEKRMNYVLPEIKYLFEEYGNKGL